MIFWNKGSFEGDQWAVFLIKMWYSWWSLFFFFFLISLWKTQILGFGSKSEDWLFYKVSQKVKVTLFVPAGEVRRPPFPHTRQHTTGLKVIKWQCASTVKSHLTPLCVTVHVKLFVHSRLSWLCHNKTHLNVTCSQKLHPAPINLKICAIVTGIKLTCYTKYTAAALALQSAEHWNSLIFLSSFNHTEGRHPSEAASLCYSGAAGPSHFKDSIKSSREMQVWILQGPS